MKILLIKLNHIGDTLLMTPAIRFLRERFPDCILDVVVRKGCESVLEGNPDITRIIPIASPERRKRSLSSSLGEWHAILRTIVNARYDYAFDLSNSDRAKFLMLLSRAKIRSINDWNARLGWKSAAFNRFTHFAWGMEHMVLRDFRAVADLFDPEAVPGALHINTSVDRAELVRKLPFLGGLENYVTIHPVSRWAYKQWLPERWAELADWVRATLGLEVLFTSGPDPGENDHVREILGRCENLARRDIRTYGSEGVGACHRRGTPVHRRRHGGNAYRGSRPDSDGRSFRRQFRVELAPVEMQARIGIG